jgi:hypothetical protein
VVTVQLPKYLNLVHNIFYAGVKEIRNAFRNLARKYGVMGIGRRIPLK